YREVAETLQAAGGDAVGPLAGVADRALRLVGRPGLSELQAARLALLARVEAERVALFGDRARLDEAKGLVARARAQASAQADTRVADAWLQWADGSTPDVALAALDASTDTAPLAFARAWLNHAAGRDDQALDFVRRAIHLDDRSVLARKLLADLKAERGENSAALEEYADILTRLAPEHVDTQIAQARLRIEVNKRAGEAVTALKGLVDQAQGLQLAPRQLAAVHDSLGRYHARQGDLGSARDAYRRAMEAAPEDPRFSTGLARLDLDEFKLDQAEVVLRKAAEADPRSASYRGLLARARMLRGDAAGALRELGAVSRLDAEGALLKGRALLDLDKPREAEDAFEQALRLDASLLDARLYRQLAAFVQGRQRRIILEDLRALRGKPPQEDQRLLDRALPFRVFADALAADNRRNEADDEYRRAIDVDPKDALAHTGRCRLAAKALAAREALGHCRKALAINPFHLPTARLAAEIGEAYMDQGAVVAALKPLTEELEPEDLRRLARAYVAMGDLKRAQGLAERPETEDASRRAIQGAVDLAEGKLRAAEQALAPVTEQLPRDPWAQLQYGHLLLQMG
ncbi:MAG: tetratricopeptide repeat protein, partial [Myxococcales bacterium]|nr:tetratricopeptide repeat protein [Myxococcales bacterium]